MNVALVTGATGFVGSRLVKKLVCDGWVVHIIVRDGSKLTELKEIVGDIHIHEYDGSSSSMTEIVSSSNPSVVFHLASLFLSEHKSDQINDLIDSNITFGTQLLEAMVTCQVYNLVNTGTSWQHYQNEQYSPVNLYAATKQAFENIVQYYVEARNIKVITLKLFDTYGEGDPRKKLIYLLMNAARTGGRLNMSPGEQQIDLVHIDDVVGAFLVAARRLKNKSLIVNEIYGVGTKNLVSLKNLVNIIEKQTGKIIDIHWGGREYRCREVMEPWCLFITIPGWKAIITLKEGLVKLCL